MKFRVLVEEKVSTIIEVQCNSRREARRIVWRLWDDGEVRLDHENCSTRVEVLGD